jgi:hypothetical protein
MSLAQVYSNTDTSKGKNNSESKVAWQKALHSAENVREQILTCLGWIESQGGTEGMTPKEFARFRNVQLNTVSGRFGDLMQLGLIRRTPYVREGSRAVELVHPPRQFGIDEGR